MSAKPRSKKPKSPASRRKDKRRPTRSRSASSSAPAAISSKPSIKPKKSLAGFAKTIPGLSYEITFDEANYIREDFDQLTHDFIITLCLVMGVLFLLIGLKEAFVAGLAIPLVFFITFGVMDLTGITLNFLSTFSLLLSLGLIVDDAIVVVSATKQYMRTGKFTPEEAVLLVLNDFKSGLDHHHPDHGLGVFAAAVFQRHNGPISEIGANHDFGHAHRVAGDRPDGQPSDGRDPGTGAPDEKFLLYLLRRNIVAGGNSAFPKQPVFDRRGAIILAGLGLMLYWYEKGGKPCWKKTAAWYAWNRKRRTDKTKIGRPSAEQKRGLAQTTAARHRQPERRPASLRKILAQAHRQ